MKREARIIAPLTDNNGRSTQGARNIMEVELATRFGGFTRTLGLGAWRTADGHATVQQEEVAVYDVATGISYDDEQALEQVAKGFCREADQECVYVRFPNGDVELVEADHDA